MAKENNKISIDVDIPANTKATFIYKEMNQVLEPGSHHLVLE